MPGNATGKKAKNSAKAYDGKKQKEPKAANLKTAALKADWNHSRLAPQQNPTMALSTKSVIQSIVMMIGNLDFGDVVEEHREPVERAAVGGGQEFPVLQVRDDPFDADAV